MLTLTLLAVLFCIVHSVMITPSVVSFVKRMTGEKYRFYRLIYNIISGIFLIYIIWYAQFLKSAPVLHWQGWLRPLQVILFSGGLILFYLGSKKYDSRTFLGLAQLANPETQPGIGKKGKLDTSGILNFVRHPWYLATLLVIWARPLDLAAVNLNTVFTMYIFIGTYLEERKLVNEFGDQYVNFQRRVSMIFPFKWIRSKIHRSGSEYEQN